MNAGIIKIPGHLLWLRQHLGGLFGVAAVLIGEALALDVDLNTPLHHQRPANQRLMGGGERAVALAGT